MLLAAKALFLRCGDYLPVPHKAGSAVMIKTGDPEDIHQLKEPQLENSV
jgi:hypothetical protein